MSTSVHEVHGFSGFTWFGFSRFGFSRFGFSRFGHSTAVTDP
jgi:hypothetical protein